MYNTFGQLGIADVFDFARRYFLLVVATTSVAIALALVHVSTAVSLYTAYGQLLIDVKVPHLANEQWREAGMVLDGAQVESQIAVLRSEPVAQAVVRRLDLLNDPDFSPPVPSSPATTAASPSSEPAERSAPPVSAGGSALAKASAPAPAATPAEPDPDHLRNAAGRIQGGLGIRRVGYSYVLEISYTSPNPEKAARIANAVMQSYIDDQIAVRAEATRQGSDWLEKRINTLRLQMNEASLKVQEFKARRDYSIVGRLPSGKGAAETDAAAPKGFTETLDELESTAMTYRRMFESVLQAYTEAEQRQSYPVSNARIISSAAPPTGRSSPKRKQALVLATVAGLIFGVGIGLMREGLRYARADRVRRDASQVVG